MQAYSRLKFILAAPGVVCLALATGNPCFAQAQAQTNAPSAKLGGARTSVKNPGGSAPAADKSKGDLSKIPGTSAELSVAPDVYRVGIEDDLQINVWREPELSVQSAIVRPDGIITVPLVNDLKVVGLTTKELQDLLVEKLKGFVNDPQVTVIVREIRSRRVYLIGEVSRPGAFPLNQRKTVLQLLAESGGLGPFAKTDSIYVLRNESGHQVKIAFNYKRSLGGKSTKDGDIVLAPGDIVVVP